MIETISFTLGIIVGALFGITFYILIDKGVKELDVEVEEYKALKRKKIESEIKKKMNKLRKKYKRFEIKKDL